MYIRCNILICPHFPVHWSPCFVLLVTSLQGFRERVDCLICTWQRCTCYTFRVTATMAAEVISSMYLEVGIGEAPNWGLSYHRQTLYRRKCLHLNAWSGGISYRWEFYTRHYDLWKTSTKCFHIWYWCILRKVDYTSYQVETDSVRLVSLFLCIWKRFGHDIGHVYFQ